MEHLIDKYRQKSSILGTRSISSMAMPVIIGNADNLKSHLVEIQGNGDGKFYDPQNRRYFPAKLIKLTAQLEDLNEEFERFVETRLSFGDPKPKTWPPELMEKKEELSARIKVAKEEIQWLESKIKEAEAEKVAKEKEPVKRHFWGSGRLSQGQLVEFCGWDVGKNEEGVLCIDDETSDFHGMEIWRLKSQVINPMHAEFRLRERLELKEAMEKNRPRKNVKFPKPPLYNKKTDMVEYPPDYHNETIKKIKALDV